MATKKKPSAEDRPPRPDCNRCGKKPAMHELCVTAKKLRITRNEGTHSRMMWEAGYDTTASVTAVLCTDCLKQSFCVEVNIRADLGVGVGVGGS